MFELLQTETFTKWRSKLKDELGRAAIAVRLARLELSHGGDARPIGSGVSELRIDHGPGYRIYFKRRGATIIILLCGGDKKSQDADIKKAKKLAKEWSE